MDHPEVIVVDVDGVLTDGKLNIDHRGEKMFKSFHTRDVRAIRELIANGVEVYLASADDWSGTKQFADKVGAQFIYLRNKEKLLERLKGRRWWAVGDSAYDIPLLKHAARGFCTADCAPYVQAILPGITRLKTPGGGGVMDELITLMEIFKPCASS